MVASFSLCVYCGAELGSDPAFSLAAREIGCMLAHKKIRLIFGGGLNGLMGETARASIQAGGTVIGIIPKFLAHLVETSCTEIIVSENMHDRKKTMFDLADAFLALPGGIGTLEEVAEQLKWFQLGHHTKSVYIFNVLGYWDPLISLLNHMKIYGFVDQNIIRTIKIYNAVKELDKEFSTLSYQRRGVS